MSPKMTEAGHTEQPGASVLRIAFDIVFANAACIRGFKRSMTSCHPLNGHILVNDSGLVPGFGGWGGGLPRHYSAHIRYTLVVI